MAGNLSERKKEERMRKQREYQRRRREKLKLDPFVYEAAKAKERERWKKRKDEKKVKNIKEKREKKITRAKWRKERQKKTEKQAVQRNAMRVIIENSPPTSDDESNNNINLENPSCSSPLTIGSTTTASCEITRQKVTGQKIRKHNYYLMKRTIEKQEQTIQKLKIKINTLKIQKKRDTVKAMQRESEKLPTRFRAANNGPNVTCATRKKDVWNFLESDEHSRIKPGKKDTITRSKVKKQRRLLSESMRNLFEKFVATNPPYKISYATFCRLKPFWVLEPKSSKRETCLCSTHENFKFMVEKLHSSNLIHEKSSNDVAKTVTCSTDNDNCMMRKCNLCYNKVPEILLFEDGPITFKKWIKTSEQRVISGVAKQVSRVVKKDISSTKVKLVDEMITFLPKFLQRKHSWSHQSKTISELKKNIAEEEVIIHMDFSENYLCKYGQEIQSVHFGASRQQITVHTVVTYHRSPTTGEIVTKSFCGLSESLRHDACAVYAHLKGIFARLLVLTPIKSVHILTDSPSSQYRNKKMFYLFSKQLVKHFNLQKANWHFHEAGHGKGAPDGIGAYVKRAADRLVAQGKDVHDLETMYRCLLSLDTKVDIFLVADEEIRAVDQLLSQPNVPKLKPIKNTMRVHQVCWEISRPDTIYLRRLSCLFCEKDCRHFGIGTYTYETPMIVDREVEISAQADEERYSPIFVFNRPRRSRILMLSDDSESIAEDISMLINQDVDLPNTGDQSSDKMASVESTDFNYINFMKEFYDEESDDENIF